jgi:hypothetical protein
MVSLIPNQAALVQAMAIAGLGQVAMLRPGEHHDVQYRMVGSGGCSR